MSKAYLSAYKIFAKTKDERLIKFLRKITKDFQEQNLYLHEQRESLDWLKNSSKENFLEEEKFNEESFLKVIKKLDHQKFLKDIGKVIIEEIDSRKKIEIISREKIGKKYLENFVLEDKTLEGRIKILRERIVSKLNLGKI